MSDSKRRWIKGYKLVRVSHNYRRVSATKSIIRYRPIVVYKLGSIVYKPESAGPLAVFTDFNRAIAFSCKFQSYEIDLDLEVYEIEYLPSEEVQLWWRWPDHRGVAASRLEELPLGTRLADAIKMSRKPVWSYTRGYLNKES